MQFAKSEYRTVEKITVYCEYSYNSGTVYFDDIQLVRDSIELDLTAGDFTAENESADETEESVAEGETAGSTAPEFEEKLDSFGNALTETAYTDGEFGTIYRSFGYTSCANGAINSGNDLIRETDARGYKTEYEVNEDTSRNEAVTDRCGNKTVYEYDGSGRTTKVTSCNSAGEELAEVGYSYDAFDSMSEIARGDGMKYGLKYNAFHELEAIGIEGKTENLVTYGYKNGNGRLKSVTYANGHTMKAGYNSLGQLIAERWYSEPECESLAAHYKYVYDGKGNIVRSIDILRKKEYTYTYENDQLIRAGEFDITVEDEMVISKDLVNSIMYIYDAEGKLSRKRIISGAGAEQEIYCENSDENTVVKFTAGGKTVTSHSKTDSFGRKIFDELQLGTGFVSRQFSYYSGQITEEHKANSKIKSTATTQLVSHIILSDGRTISYEYDAEERITKITDSIDGTTEYTYDALGQLLTEIVNDTAVNTMTYDNYGNILTKNGIIYTYDTVWKDLLTGYGNQTISYDAQGNPTSYLGHTLTWEKGRQLKSFDSNTYTYNANGIRTSKTVNGVEHKYFLDGTKILRETWGENVLIPLYDNEDSVCGVEYNGEPFYFLKNLQGDVVSIIDRNGDLAARYSYDAWGVCTVEQDESDVGIANINPFRYRSYYFDAEIGMYYLQSRYYDPLVGRFINADEVGMIKLQLKNKMFLTNLYSYCYNNSINEKDETGYGGANALLEAVITAFDLIVGINDFASAQKYTDREKKKIRKSTNKSKRQIEREIASAKKASKKLSKAFKIVSILLSVMSIILLIYTCASNATSILRAITDCVVELFITLLVEGVSFVVDLLLKLVPVPGLGFVLGFLAGILIQKIFSSWFNKNKTKRVQNKFYSSTAPLVKKKSTDVMGYITGFINSLGA